MQLCDKATTALRQGGWITVVTPATGGSQFNPTKILERVLMDASARRRLPRGFRLTAAVVLGLLTALLGVPAYAAGSWNMNPYLATITGCGATAKIIPGIYAQSCVYETGNQTPLQGHLRGGVIFSNTGTATKYVQVSQFAVSYYDALGFNRVIFFGGCPTVAIPSTKTIYCESEYIGIYPNNAHIEADGAASGVLFQTLTSQSIWK
jgi:hypothetical protein